MTIEFDENRLSDINAESMNWNIKDELKGLSLKEINNRQPKLPYAICLLNTTGSLNIGVSIRSAVLFGAAKVFIAGRRRFDRRSTVGAQAYVELDFIESHESSIVLEKIESENFTPILIETGGVEFSKERMSSIERPCFIFGEEKNGISSEYFMRGYQVLSLPTIGVLRSLNLSAAVSIICYEQMKLDV